MYPFLPSPELSSISVDDKKATGVVDVSYGSKMEGWIEDGLAQRTSILPGSGTIWRRITSSSSSV